MIEAKETTTMGKTPSLSRLREIVAAGAVCGPDDAHLFFGPDGERAAERNRRERQAGRVCAGCPVAWECHLYAVRAGEWHGVWGGVGEHRRRQVIRQRWRNLQAHGDTPAAPEPQRCRRGHLVTGDNIYRQSDGYRRCRICLRAAQRADNERQRRWRGAGVADQSSPAGAQQLPATPDQGSYIRDPADRAAWMRTHAPDYLRERSAT